jgi:hypothetical protein
VVAAAAFEPANIPTATERPTAIRRILAAQPGFSAAWLESSLRQDMEEFVTSFKQIVFILTVGPLEIVLVKFCPHSIPD